MKQCIFTLTSSKELAPGTFEMVLSGDTSAICAPGQFVNIRLDGFFLRRPISVSDCSDGQMTLIYKVVGKGTRAMSQLPAGTELDVLTGLGNGYCLDRAGSRPLLIGGGAGVPPMVWLARALKERGVNLVAILGFNTASEIFAVERFEEIGAEVILCTADGSAGIKGFVTDGMKVAGTYSYTYACGPEPMLRAVYDLSTTDGEYSFEERMGCGFGACMGCSCQTKYGSKRICKDGPVLTKEEIRW